MKNKTNNPWIFLILLMLIFGCSNDDDATTDPDLLEPENEINDFLWKGMNYWYYYQNEVEDLADTKDDNLEEYNSYLNSYSEPEELFNSLVYTQEDDFSWYIEDVDAQANAFRGISESYGINLGFVVFTDQSETDMVAYVGYVSKNSPASAAGIQRGDLIYKVDGTTLNGNNFELLNKLFTESSISLGFATYVDGNLEYDQNDITLSPELLNENPVYYHDVLEKNGKNIGYLVYNSFVHTYHEELNAVFGEFKNQNIDELVLDLRYNGGGSVITAAFLASMIDGNVADGEIFADLVYNDKRDRDQGAIYPFFDTGFLYDKSTGEYTGEFPLNRLTSLNRLYVITTSYTASASEMIINGLRPYMDVIVVGDTTVGKNEGSITLYDSEGDYTDSENRNPNHNVGMQPIVFHIFNSKEESNYDEGFAPDIEILEGNFAADIKPFGDDQEALLEAATDNILGMSPKQTLSRALPSPEVGKVKGEKFSTEMYILPSDSRLLK